jgi:hypothetical protein
MFNSIVCFMIFVSSAYAHKNVFKKGIKPAATLSKLVYYGGPVVSNVKVVTVWWGGASNVQYTTQLEKFYGAVTNSSWFNVLNEYTTSTQTIGTGSWVSSFSDNFAPTGVLTDAQIQSRLVNLISNGSLPASDSNTYYSIHFAPGISISSNGGSCVAGGFCAYHGTINNAGKYIYYGVVPDQSGGCSTGCGSNSVPFNNLCSVASHELAEMVTDPGVGLATTYSPPLAWYDATNGEIGDICNAQQGTTVGSDGITYVIQKIFSNKANACVAAPVSTTTTSSSTTSTTTTTSSTTNISTIKSPSTTTSSTTTITASTTKTSTTSLAPSPTPLSTCAHSKCVTGVLLKSGCDPCVTKIISKDSYCGKVRWDSVCVNEVKSICGISPCI